jgi:hypothetical protein
MRTMKYAGGGETQAKIDKLQKLIDSPSTPETDKKNFREAIKKFKEKLASESKEVEKPKPTVSKPVAKKPTTMTKPVVKKPTTTSKPVAKKPTAPSKPIAKKPTTTTKPVAKKSTASKPVVKKSITKAKPLPKTTSIATDKKLPKGVKMVSKKIVLVNGKEMNTDSQEWCDYLTAEFIKRKEQAKKNKGNRKKTKSVMAQVSTKIEQGVEKAIKTGVSKQMPTIKKNPQVFIGKVQKLETATKNFLTQLKEVLGTEYDAKEVTDTTKAIHKLIEDLKKKYTKK